MKTLIVFYSRTGTTKKVADFLAEKLGTDLEEIKEEKSRGGVMGYLRSGREAMKKDIPKILGSAKNPAQYGLVLIGTPVWAGTMASPIRTYLEQNKDKFTKLAFFSTQGSAKEQKVFSEMAKVCGKEPIFHKYFTTKSVARDEYQTDAEDFGRKLMGL